MKGRSTRGTTGLGTVEVRGRRRGPSPPARISACMSAPGSRAGTIRHGGPADGFPGSGGRARRGGLERGPSHALVGESGSGDGGGVEVVAAVHHNVPAHALSDLVPVELAELRPL